ncbi:MAG: D-2-hydroxyacid dehydrogenase [Chloroflexi bacterium]|nr:D-2-hydroxyacid dehydrogenase [Chloroflexota bacterium]
MPDVNATVTLGIGSALLDQIRAVDGRLAVTLLTRPQRRLYRGGRPIWFGYVEPSEGDIESEEEARRNLEAVLAQTEVIFSSPIVPPDILTLAPALRWVQLTSAGVDRLVESDLLRSGVMVTTASGIHAVPIGEYVIGMMLAFAKGLPRAFRAQSEAAWRPYLAEELEGKTVGVIGLGAIGKHVAKLAKGLGMRVLAVRRSDGAPPVEHIDRLLPRSGLAELLAESDYVVVAAPLTAETRHLIGDEQLAAMKPSAVIINISRGAIIDEMALVRALKEGRIAGAGLDVFAAEPLPPESDLWRLENVIVTPHISGGTPRYLERAVALFCDNLRRYLAGEPPRNLVDVGRGY